MRNHEYKALTIARDTLEVVENFLKEEDGGNESARQNAKHALKNHLVETEDGSYTLKSASLDGKSETMHTHHGALSEAMEKFVKPAHLEGKNEIYILDICSGLGYNTASCIECLGDEVNIKIDMVEISLETLTLTLLLEAPLESYRIIQKSVEDKLYGDGNIKCRHFEEEVPENIRIDIHIDDARVAVGNLVDDKTYGAIFLDPFSPLKSPELYTVEFFRLLKSLLKPDGIILTYTSAAPVRAAMVENGLHVGEGPSFGRSGGTLASLNPEMINKQLSSDDERMIALSDAGIPFKDPDFDCSSIDILNHRDEERKLARSKTKFSSTVKTPIYLDKDLEDGRLKRRVLNNLKNLGFNDLKSNEAKYIICPQYTDCICGKDCENFKSSRERIYEMTNRLSLILKNP